MKKFVLLSFVLALTCFHQLIADPLPIGSKMPMADVKMLSIHGKEVSMKDMLSKNGVLVIFSCNTCPYVIKNEKRIKEITAYALKNGFGVIVLNSNEAQRGDVDSYDAMKAYAKKQKYTFNYVIDKNHAIADAFDAKRTPECFLFNKDLTLVYHGAIDDSPADASAVQRVHLKEAINECAAGNAVSIQESKSIGCTIKRLKS
ncbi:MAG: thioredoxin family protein [Ferruginibacter sp.]|nr:thioredoxin family protein [Ferruginibacter sp.]